VYRSSRANYQTGGYTFRPMSDWNGTVGSVYNALTKCTQACDWRVTTKLGQQVTVSK